MVATTRLAILWVTANGEIEGKSWEDLATKLKAPAPKKKATESTHTLRVFNRLGAAGWEFVAQRGGESGGAFASLADTVWIFKRKVVK
jgi:hypothetical protein